MDYYDTMNESRGVLGEDEGYNDNCPMCKSAQQQMKEHEEKLNLAGEYGLKLQEELQDTHIHMEKMRGENEAQVEGMIQEIYELKCKLESMERTLDDQKLLMKQTVDDFNMSKERVITESTDQTNMLQKEKTTALAQLNQVQLREKQLNEKIVQLEEKNASLLKEKQNKREEVNVNVSYTQEMFELHEKVVEMEILIEVSNADNVKLRNENEMLSLSVENLRTELVNLQKEFEAAESKGTSYFNHLERAREETNEVKAELETLKETLKQSGHLAKGNSLFGEVEDERMMMEKKLKTMEVKYESLQKPHIFLKSQHHNLKSQVTALLSLHSGKADIDYTRNLERALSQLKSENADLLNKLKNQGSGDNKEVQDIDLKELCKNLPNFENNEDIVDFLKIQLEESKGQIKKLSNELNQLHMIKMAESDKLLTAEQKLHETGTNAEKYKNANMKLRLKLEEVENKYKAETQKRILVEKKFNYDSSNDVEPIGIHSAQKKKSPPQFMKREEEKKSLATTQGKTNKAKNKFSSDDWGEVVRILQKGKGVTTSDKAEDSFNMPPPTVRKIKFSEEADIIPEIDESSVDCKTDKDRKVNFNEDVFPTPGKENLDDRKEKAPSVPSSCLKKSSSSLKKTSSSRKGAELCETCRV